MSTTRRGFLARILALPAVAAGAAIVAKQSAAKDVYLSIPGCSFKWTAQPGQVLMMEPDPETGGYKHVWTDPPEVT